MNLIKTLRIMALCLPLATATAAAQTTTTLINEGWRFCKDPRPDTASLPPAGAAWQAVCLPHTWNALDGQDGGRGYHGGGVYYRGTGWYDRTLRFSRQDAGRQIYLHLGAANYCTEVFLNGRSVGTHNGGYTAFALDLTPYIRFGADNRLSIRVSNAADMPVPPQHADFTFFGGLPRNAEIISKNRLHITRLDHGSCGVRISQDSVSSRHATVTVTAGLRNCHPRKRRATVTVNITDHLGRTVASASRRLTVAAGQTASVAQTLHIDSPHLWNGTHDPYLYRTEVTVTEGRHTADREVQPLGLRFYRIDPDRGFLLNGAPYPLRGVAMHEGRMDKGNAVTDSDRREDIRCIRQMGANYIRLAHYQHGDFTYNCLDSLGIICWTEIPLIDSIRPGNDFRNNCRGLLTSLIRQLCNHPCVAFWGLSNEINFYKGPDPLPLIRELNSLAHAEDPTRPTVLAAMHHEKPVNFVPDAYSINPYWKSHATLTLLAKQDCPLWLQYD